jgi:hypothetical protein
VYGGKDVDRAYLSSVEMLDGAYWKTLPTPMFIADAAFSSVALPN